MLSQKRLRVTVCCLVVLFAVRMSSWGQSWGSQQGYNGWSWHHGSWKQAWQWYARRQMVEVQELCCRQQEQDSVRSEKINTWKKWEEVASKLAAVAAGRDSHQPMDVQTNELDLKAGKAKLAKVEAALRAMPVDDEDFANERNAITAKIAGTKAGMAENKPIGARIDAARRRLTRAQHRAKEAAAALEMAQRVVEESDVEIACIECELHDLEAALAHAPAVPAEICTDNTVDAVSAQLQRLLNILKDYPGVDPNLVSLATAHSAQLIAGFQHAFEEVERVGSNLRECTLSAECEEISD